MKKAIITGLILTAVFGWMVGRHLTGLRWRPIWKLYSQPIMFYTLAVWWSFTSLSAALFSFFPGRNAMKLASMKRQFESGQMEVRRERS